MTGTSSSSAHGLADYGWTDELERAFAPYRDRGAVPARIVRVERGRAEAATDTGPVNVLTPATHGQAETVCTGDWVALSPGSEGREPVVEAVLPRRTAVVRSSSSRTSHSQVLAANVDTVAVTVSLAAPFKHGRTERMLALAWESGAQPVVVLTKADECPDAASAEAEVAEVALGADVLTTSAVTGQGMDILRTFLHGTVVLFGPSGAGKSTLGNHLLGQEQLATGTVRESDGKGRHTTAWRELLPLPGGGVLLDTPGVRGIGLHESTDGVEQVFAEITHLSQECRFTDCAHDSEPGCAVLAALESGELPQRRLDSYRRLLRENAHAAARTDARLRAEHKATNKKRALDLRAIYQHRGKKR